jgi:hypothetical protein
VNSESREAHKESKANDGTNKVPPIPSDLPPISDVPTRNTKNETTNQTEWERRHYRMQFSIFIVGIIVMFIYAGQLYEMRKSTQAATAAIKLARDSSHLDQRAWVADEMISGKAELDKRYVIKISAKNTGKTFAKDFVSTSAFKGKYLSDPDPDFDREIANAATSTNSIGLLPPNGGFDQEVPAKQGQKITEDDIREFSNPTVVFLVFGKITYKDIFKCKHWTTFCYRALPVEGKYITYATYNDADNNRCP